MAVARLSGVAYKSRKRKEEAPWHDIEEPYADFAGVNG